MTTTIESGKQRALLFDLTRCSGCGECVEACAIENQDGLEVEGSEVRDLSATSYCALREKDDLSYRLLCRHCVVPSCVSVCPVGALEKTELGPVTYDADKCMGCRYCMTACPFEVPRYEWFSATPRVRKCTMCHDRQVEGKPTACTEVCPNEATVGGTREELIKEAWARIEEDPDEYHPHVYGEHEIGGTSVLFLSPVPIPELGFDPALGNEPIPMNTWRVLSKIPGIVVAAAGSLLAFWWITQRRDDVAEWEAKQAAANAGSDHATNGKDAGHKA